MIRILPVVIFSLVLFAAPAAHAEEPGFARGYAQALLDEHHSEMGLEARPTKEVGVIEVAGEQCLPAAQQKQIRERLTGTGPILKVQWLLTCESKATTTVAQADTGLIWLPTTDIFRPLQADPREPELALGLQFYDTRGDTFVVGEVSAGETFSLVEGKLGNGTWQLGIQGGVFSVFDQEEESNDLFNTDFLVGIPLSYREGPWSARGRIYHISSHLGDEFIINNGVTERLDISYEAIDLVVSHEWDKFRLYGGGGYIYRTTEDLDRSMLQAGVEWRTNDVIGELDLSLGADFKSLDAQGWRLNQAYQAALIFTRNQREVRFLMELYDGKSPNAQFLFNRLQYFGFGIQFGI